MKINIVSLVCSLPNNPEIYLKLIVAIAIPVLKPGFCFLNFLIKVRKYYMYAMKLGKLDFIWLQVWSQE